MTSDVVLTETRGEVALITLNRPAKFNALEYPLIDRVMETLDVIQ